MKFVLSILIALLSIVLFVELSNTFPSPDCYYIYLGMCAVLAGGLTGEN